MSKLLENEYFHFGTDNIYKELWLNLQMRHLNDSYTKPIGGLWASNLDNEYISDWLRYVAIKEPHNFDIIVGNKPSCILKFKENAKFLKIENQNDYKNLKDSGFIIELDTPIILNKNYIPTTITEIPNYEKIAEYYDLIYINAFIQDCFKQFRVNTMLATNPDSIEYYKSIDAYYTAHEILSISEKKHIQEPNKEYYEFLKYVRSLFINIEAKTYEEFIYKLDKLKKSILEDLKNNYDLSRLNLKTNLNPEKVLKTITENIAQEKHTLAKKVYKDFTY